MRSLGNDDNLNMNMKCLSKWNHFIPFLLRVLSSCLLIVQNNDVDMKINTSYVWNLQSILAKLAKHGSSLLSKLLAVTALKVDLAEG